MGRSCASAAATASITAPPLLLCAGERYEGEWQRGREEGVGTFVAPDGSTFYGSWRGGQMHGEGVYKPSAVARQQQQQQQHGCGG